VEHRFRPKRKTNPTSSQGAKRRTSGPEKEASFEGTKAIQKALLNLRRVTSPEGVGDEEQAENIFRQKN